MTTSIYNSSAEALTHKPETETLSTLPPATAPASTRVEVVHTVASRFIILLLCLALVLSTLAYGTVYYWTLAVFQAGAALIIFFWAVDAARTRVLRWSSNPLQLPLLGLILLGLIQLLPLGAGSVAVAPGVEAARSLSLDPYSTRLVLVQLCALFVYFAAALAFIDSPRRLRVVVRTIIVFGTALALFGLIQSFTSPTRIYWVRELGQATAFGPFINRHHFAAYMEMALALPVGLILAGAIERDKLLLFIFAPAIMGIALIMTNSRGGIISLMAEAGFFVIIAGASRSGKRGEKEKRSRARSLMLRAGLVLALLFAMFTAVVFLGGEAGLSRFVGTVNAEDPTTGRAHFWKTTLHIIRDNPFIGSGLGSFGVAYTLYDTRNGLLRLEQAHNDYLQTVADAGVVGALLGLAFIFLLFRLALARRETEDRFRRGVATGALAGCFAVLVHSFFDFTLHTTANALLFLVLAAVATVNGRVEETGDRQEQEQPQQPQQRRRRRRRHTE